MPDTDQQVRDLVDAARRRDPEERAAYLDAACAGRPELRAAVAAWFDEGFRTVEARTIGSYIIRGELGRGGMGIVYLADDTRLSRRVALKAIAPHLNADPSARERLRREARIAAGLSHPGIATVYALEEIDGELYLAAEYVAGKSLRALLEGGALAMPQVIDTARQLATALAAAHAQGVTHRDLKPENIIQTPAGTVKILDFGLARLDGAFAPFQTQTGVITGTPAYMSPEQARGEAVDFRTDFFAFGLIVYEMTTGANPFVAETLAATLARMLEMEPAPLVRVQPGCPPDLHRVVLMCLKKSAAERYASTDQLVADLSRVDSGQTVSSGAAARADGPAASETLPSGPPGRLTITGWWKIHHVGVIAVEAVALSAAWQARSVMPQPYASVLWLLALACVISGASVRLHLLFTRRVQPSDLANQVRLSRPWLRTCDIVLCGLLLAFALNAIGEDRPASVTALVVISTLLLIATFVIEPATTAAALVEHRSSRVRGLEQQEHLSR